MEPRKLIFIVRYTIKHRLAETNQEIEILGIPKDATEPDIKKAYRKVRLNTN
jgi:DnaJ-class molecular chaperone